MLNLHPPVAPLMFAVGTVRHPRRKLGDARRISESASASMARGLRRRRDSGVRPHTCGTDVRTMPQDPEKDPPAVMEEVSSDAMKALEAAAQVRQ
jgi:hypothetical protein